MDSKYIKSCVAAALLTLGFANAHAASVSLLPVGGANIAPGEVITLEVWADFSDTPTTGTVGGSFDITYDTAVLTYNGDFAFDPGFGADPGFSFTGDDCSGGLIFDCTKVNEISYIAPTSFNDMAETNSLMGTLSFTGKAAGVSVLSMATSLDEWAWADSSTFGNIEPDYVPATITVSAIPVPAAVWLMASGLGVLGGVIRRKTAA